MKKSHNKKPGSVFVALAISLILFYIGNRYIDQVVLNPLPLPERFSPALTDTIESIISLPLYIAFDLMSILGGGALFFLTWIIWSQYFAQFGTYRTGEDQGSATWGSEKEGERFKDLKNVDNNLVFTDKLGLALSREKFDMRVDRNLNVMVVGGSGSGKTRGYVKPNLLQLNSNYFVTDPKGTLPGETGHLFRDNDYQIKVFNTIDFKQSLKYNPLKYVKTDAEILSFVNCLIKNTTPEGSTSNDPFWENSEKLLYVSLIALLRDWFRPEDYSLSGLLTLLSMAEAKEDDESFNSPLDLMFMQIERGKKYQKISSPHGMEDEPGNFSSDRRVSTSRNSGGRWMPSKFKHNTTGVMPAKVIDSNGNAGLSADDDFALGNYKAFKTAAGKTLKSIIISCNVRLKPLAIQELRDLLKEDEMELDTLGDIDNKSVIFAVMSDTDNTFAFLFAIMMWQAINVLCNKALIDYGGRLPRPVHFICDEFAQLFIPDIQQTIAVTRSRNIFMSLIVQSIAQLEAKYEKHAQTIVDCCDTTLFLGGKSNSTNEEITKMIGKQTIMQISTGQSHQTNGGSSNQNYQVQGRDLIDSAEIGKFDRSKAIVLIAGANPLQDYKYDPSNHHRYHYIDPGHEGADYKEKFDFMNYHQTYSTERRNDIWTH